MRNAKSYPEGATAWKCGYAPAIAKIGGVPVMDYKAALRRINEWSTIAQSSEATLRAVQRYAYDVLTVPNASETYIIEALGQYWGPFPTFEAAERHVQDHVQHNVAASIRKVCAGEGLKVS